EDKSSPRRWRLSSGVHITQPLRLSRKAQRPDTVPQSVKWPLACPVSTEVARPKRFELLTPRFVVWCSIQASYGRLVPRRRMRRDSPRPGIAIGSVQTWQGFDSAHTPHSYWCFARLLSRMGAFVTAFVERDWAIWYFQAERCPDGSVDQRDL